MVLSQSELACELIYFATLSIIKISILLFYRSLFPGRLFSIVTDILGGIVIAWGISSLVASTLACQPISEFWTHKDPSACKYANHFFIGNSVPNICTDIIILALPVSQVWQLRLSINSKIVVSGLFLLGGL